MEATYDYFAVLKCLELNPAAHWVQHGPSEVVVMRLSPISSSLLTSLGVGPKVYTCM